MKATAKAMLVPLVLCVAVSSLYTWRMLHVWPPGKESWIEEGMIMMGFHATCVLAILPVLIWSMARNWRDVRLPSRIGLLVASACLFTATVVLPEVALSKMERIRPNKSTNQFPSYLGNRLC